MTTQRNKLLALGQIGEESFEMKHDYDTNRSNFLDKNRLSTMLISDESRKFKSTNIEPHKNDRSEADHQKMNQLMCNGKA